MPIAGSREGMTYCLATSLMALLLTVPFLAAMATVSHAAPPKTPELKPGVVLIASAKFGKREYLLPGGTEDGNAGAITIQGDNLTVDFGGATLRGTLATT